MNDTYLKKAKILYKEYVRGYVYQKELLENLSKNMTGNQIKEIENRKEMFLNKLIVLEDVFGKDCNV